MHFPWPTRYIHLVFGLLLLIGVSCLGPAIPVQEPVIVTATWDGVGIPGVELRGESGTVLGVTDANGEFDISVFPDDTQLVPVFFGYKFSPDTLITSDEGGSFIATAEPIVQNGDFEQVSGNMPEGWSWVNSSAPPGTTYGVTTLDAITGQYAAFIDIPAGSYDSSQWWPRIMQNYDLPHEVIEPVTIRVSYWIRTESVTGEGARAWLYFYDENEDRVMQDTVRLTGSNDWQRVERQFIIPAGTSRIEFWMTMTHGSGRVYFDDYQVQRVISNPANPQQIVLTYNDCPMTSMTISWRTDVSVDNPTVKYSSDQMAAPESFSKSATGQSHPSSFWPGKWLNSVELTGLSPGTEYAVTILAGDRNFAQPETFHFSTIPENEEIVFLAGADSHIWPGSSTNPRRATNRLAAEHDPDFILFPGDLWFADDYFYDAQYREKPESMVNSWFDDWSDEVITAAGRRIPIVPARGNHDKEPYRELFQLPQYHDYYVKQFGPDLTIITLNSGHEISIAGEQTQWLEQTLQQYQDSRWLIVQHHVSPYPSHLADDHYGTTWIAEIRQHWVPLYEQYGVDLVITGHDHVYMRSLPIKNNGVDPNGVIYLICSTWDARGTQAPHDYRWYFDEVSQEDVFFFRFTVSADAEELLVEPISANGVGTPLVLDKTPFDVDPWQPPPDDEPGEPVEVLADSFAEGQMDNRWSPRAETNWEVAEEAGNHFLRSPYQGGSWTSDAIDLNDVSFGRINASVAFDVRLSHFSENTSVVRFRFVGGGAFYQLMLGHPQYGNPDVQGLSFWHGESGVAPIVQLSDVTFTESDWYSFEVVFDGGVIRVYQDSNLVIEFNNSSLSSFDSLVIVSQDSTLDVDNVRIIEDR